MSSPLLTRSYQILSGAWRQRYVIMLPILILPLVGALVSMLSAPKVSVTHVIPGTGDR